MTPIDRGTLLELVRNRPLLAAELLGAALGAGDEEPAEGEPPRRRMAWLELTSTDDPTLASRYREIMAAARRSRARAGEVLSEGLIPFLRARIDEDLDQAHTAAHEDGADRHKAERDLTAKRNRVDFLESVLVRELYLAIEEHAQAEHLLRLEAAAYNWHTGYQDEWRP